MRQHKAFLDRSRSSAQVLQSVLVCSRSTADRGLIEWPCVLSCSVSTVYAADSHLCVLDFLQPRNFFILCFWGPLWRWWRCCIVRTLYACIAGYIISCSIVTSHTRLLFGFMFLQSHGGTEERYLFYECIIQVLRCVVSSAVLLNWVGLGVVFICAETICFIYSSTLYMATPQ